MGSVLVHEPPPQDVPGRRLRESLRQPLAGQTPSDAMPYRLSEDERRKMRELLRSQAHEDSQR